MSTAMGLRTSVVLLSAVCCVASPLLRAQAVKRVLRPANAVDAPRVEELRILRSDAQTFVVEYRPRYRPMKNIPGERNQVFQFQDFDRAVSAATPADAGSPDLQYRAIALGLPSSQGNSVQILAADYEDIPGVFYAPVPALKLEDGMLVAQPLAMQPDRYSEGLFLPSQIARLANAEQCRTMVVGTLTVFPVQYNSSSRTLRRYSRLVIQVVFAQPRGVRVRDVRDDRLFEHSLLNYSVARMWQTAPERRTAAVVPSVLASGTWYKIPVTEEGMYRLDGNFFASAGLNLSGVDPHTIRIFGNGGMELSENAAAPRPVDLVENAIYVSGESDGSFDAGDYLLFYGKSSRGWVYNPTLRTSTHYINHYTETNYYWLTFGGASGKRMQIRPSATLAATIVPDRFTDHVFVEEERSNLLNSGKDWLGQSVAPGGSFTYVNMLTGLAPNDLIRYRARMVSQLGVFASMSVREGTTALGTVSLGTPGGYEVATAGNLDVTGSSTLAGNQSQLTFSYNSSSVTSTGWIDWIEIGYPRTLSATGDRLQFRSGDAPGTAEYQIQGFSSMPMVFDVTTPDSVIIISGVGGTAVQGTYAFRSQEGAGRVSEYLAQGPGSAWKTPTGVERFPTETMSLRGYTDSTDFIIITSQDFLSAANRLADFRRRPEHGGLKTFVVDVNQIYNEFGGGLPDMVAVRDFLMYAFDNWNPRPTFVLFFGGASFDYKGILGFQSNYVPTWQSPESMDDVYSYSTDDFLTSHYPSFTPYFVSGRLSCRNPQEAGIVVDKILRYDTASAQDNWKMRMLFVGDDAWTSDQTSDFGDGTVHSQDEEDLANQDIPDEFEKKKIYIAEYPTVLSAQGRRKPGAYKDIIDDINQGVLEVNFAGHGNPTVWAHERIFQVETSIPQLVNADRLSFFVLATCNFSQFDNAKEYTGGELLMNKPDGGSVALVSATRKVYQNENRALNMGMHSLMFLRDSFGRVVVDRPAAALFEYKAGQTSGQSINDQKYFFMGDPTMRLQYPSGYASIDSINAQRVDSVGGAPRHSPIPMRSLSKVTVVGTVRDANNVPDPSVNGRALIAVNDATRGDTILNFYPGARPWGYVLTGGTIYRGENSVVNGRFRASFIVPKDISYSDSTAHGRLVAYFYAAQGSGREGVAYTNNIWISATDTSALHGEQGPSITIYLDNRNFRTGDLVNENPKLIVDLADTVGINTSGSGIGHRIEAWVNNGSTSTDITDFYRSNLDDYRKGTLQYQLKDLPQGKNSLRVRAWDSFNNSAVAQADFTVLSGDQMSITDVMNYPNPFASGTLFTLKQNQTEPVQITIKVYTLAGRMIQSIEATTGGESFVRVPWDGRDRDGDILANGVYFYKVVARTLDGRSTSEALGKLTVLK